MELIQIADFELTYTTLLSLDYGAGGQIYGTMDGTVAGDDLRGELHLTNLALRRPDDVNLPTLRGLLRTDDGADVFVELNGIATLRPADGARVFATSMTFRTGAEPYRWLNTTFGLVEGVLDSVGVGGVARGRIHRCAVTMNQGEPAS